MRKFLVPITVFLCLVYPHVGLLYKQGNTASKCYVTETDEYMEYLVTNTGWYALSESCKILTSVAWAIYLVEGTMRLDWERIPEELKSLENQEEKSTLHANAEKKVLCWFHIDK